MDGKIVANKITTGTMYADRIKGGTLTLGGENNSYGKLIIKDGSGKNVGFWNKDGITSTNGTRKVTIKEASIEAFYNNEKNGYLDLSASYASGQEAVIGGTHDLIFEIGPAGTFHFIQRDSSGQGHSCGTIDGGGWHGDIDGGYVSDIRVNGYGPYTPDENGIANITDVVQVIVFNGNTYYPDADGVIEINT